jgi:hypothetical protein
VGSWYRVGDDVADAAGDPGLVSIELVAAARGGGSAAVRLGADHGRTAAVIATTITTAIAAASVARRRGRRMRLMMAPGNSLTPHIVMADRRFGAVMGRTE